MKDGSTVWVYLIYFVWIAIGAYMIVSTVLGTFHPCDLFPC